MILLTSTSDKIQVVTGSAATLDVHASWVDNVAGTVTPGSTETAIATAATTDVVAVPGSSSTQRNVKSILVRNKHATQSTTVTVQKVNASATFELFKTTLLAGESLQFVEGDGFASYDTSGSKKVAQSGAGRYLRTTVLSAGTSFTTGPQTTQIVVRMVGGGAGGGGCTSLAAAASAGGGGGGGGYAEKTFAVSPNTAYAYVIGAAGNGASGALGGNATDSTFTVGATTVTAKGGTGAPVATAATTLTAYLGGTGGTISTNGDVNAAGRHGEPGVVLIVATPILVSGNGADSQFGAGGKGLTAVGNGNNALGFGAGGSGAATGASAVRTGGNGTGGCIVVDEYA